MKMEVIHSTKVTHNFTASKRHIGGFFEALSRMCEDQTYTDLHLVAGDGQIFAAHQIIVGSCSALIKQESENPKIADNLTVYLPDFSSGAIKSLLCLMYTGSSGDECSPRELKQLISALRIELRFDSGNVVSLARASSSSSSSVKLSNGYEQKINTNSYSHSHNRSTPKYHRNQLNHLVNHGSHVNDDNNEILEVTPDLPIFGNHFLSNDDSEENSGTPNSFYQQGGDFGELPKGFLCRLCGRNTPSTASLFAHFLYPHYAHLWRTEIPQRKNKYDCEREGCNYTTKNRQHFVMHVARVHDDLRIKMQALGENLEILDNLDAKKQNVSADRIYSKHAKMRHSPEEKGIDIDDGTNGYLGESGHGSPNVTNSPKFINLHDGEVTLSPIKFQSPHHPGGLVGGKTVRCRLCGKCWKGKDTSNFFTHMVSTHFKYLWSAEVPKSADMYNCHVPDCDYRTKYRYNFLFHLAGRHKQLKEKLLAEGISPSIIKPVRTDETNEHLFTVQKLESFMVGHDDLSVMESLKKFGVGTTTNKQLLKMKKRRKGRPPKGKGPIEENEFYFGTPGGAGMMKNDQIKLICRICKKISLNHTCHRQHVVHKHFNQFWSSHTTDEQGQFRCHHNECNYATPNRSVFVIHLAYKHFELKSKLEDSGRDPGCADPDVYGKRKYRRNQYDNTQHESPQNTLLKIKIQKKSDKIASSHRSLTPPIQENLEIQPNLEEETSENKTRNATEQEDEVGNTSSTPTQFLCRICQEEFRHYRFLVEHMALSHFNHIWNADTDVAASENGGGDNAAEYATSSDENPYAVSPTGPYDCHMCGNYHTDSRNKFIVHLACRHDVLKPMMGEYADFKVDGDNYYEGGGGAGAAIDDAENDIEGQGIEFDIDDEMEEEDDIGDGEDIEGEEEFEDETFQTTDQDEVTVDEMDGLNVGEIDEPSDVENESDDEVQIQ